MRQQDLRALLAEHGLAPHARFGQNFLVDPALLRAIPGDAGVQSGETVLEIGPGAGGLTRALLAAGARVVAIEVDRGLTRLLRATLAGELDAGRLRLIEGDALAPEERLHPGLEEAWQEAASSGAAPRLVSNLPYAISGPFLARLPGRPLSGATLLLQREVAEKAAGPVAGEWSPLSVRLALAFRPRLGRRVPPEVFWPRPEVESAFLHLEPHPAAPDSARQPELAAALRCAFAQRRKLLLPRLDRERPAWAAALRALGVAANSRPGQLGPEIWRAALLRLQ